MLMHTKNKKQKTNLNRGFTPLEKNIYTSRKSRKSSLTGFTLIEILVSVAIFAVVMLIALGALLAMSESDRKAQTLKSVINNLNFSIDSMSRTIRTGQNYHCNIAQGSIQSPRDCNSASNSFALLSSTGATVVYRLENANRTLCVQPSGAVGCIVRSLDGGASYVPITAPEVVVSSLQFIVVGAESAAIQPKVALFVSGSVAASGNTNNCTGTSAGTTCFTLQTSVTQRLYDQ